MRGILGLFKCTSDITGDALADDVLNKLYKMTGNLIWKCFVDKDMMVLVPWLGALQHES